MEVMAVITPERASKRQNGRRVKHCGEPMFTLTTQDRHGVIMIGALPIKEATHKGYTWAFVGDSVNVGVPNSKTRRGRVGRKIANTLTCQAEMAVVVESNRWKHRVRIRKLTPRECWRLQGFPDYYFDKAAKVNSDSQLYKQSGNAVTVNVAFTVGIILKQIELEQC